MKLFTLLTLMLALAPRASMATVYDENAADLIHDQTVEQLVMVGEASEKMLASTHEDLSRAHVVAVINKSKIGSTSQMMRVYVDGTLTYEWKVSTGREKVERAKSGRTYVTATPVGYFRPTVLEVNHFSRTWKADMPHAVFFNGGIAVHASTHLDQLGKRASGGCVRLAPENAKIFFDLVSSVEVKEIPKIDRTGKAVVDAEGKSVSISNRDVLIIVENHA